MKEIIVKRIQESITVKRNLIKNNHLLSDVEILALEITKCLKAGNKLIICGNGGSASDALHFAGEIVGRFQKERDAWPVVVLNSDVATMTAVSNDYGFGEVFARQAQGHCKPGDIFIGISTSGNSENIIRAVDIAKKKGSKTAALLGKDGGKLGKVVEFPIVVPCDVTARVQESHILLIHILCEIVEEKMG